jgi:hypothetical protein
MKDVVFVGDNVVGILSCSSSDASKTAVSWLPLFLSFLGKLRSVFKGLTPGRLVEGSGLFSVIRTDDVVVFVVALSATETVTSPLGGGWETVSSLG